MNPQQIIRILHVWTSADPHFTGGLAKYTTWFV